MANIDWHDYKGGPLPAGAQWVQYAHGGTASIDDVDEGEVDIIRYYGPAAEPEPEPEPQPEPVLPIPREEWEEMAQECVTAIFNGENVYVLHPADYERCGLGIPAKRGENNCHEYRPLVVLEWISDMVKAAK